MEDERGQKASDSKKNEGRVRGPGVAITERAPSTVADTGNRRVDVFNPDGAFLSAIGPTVGTLSSKSRTTWLGTRKDSCISSTRA